jgi:hypothetical protein
MPTLSRIIPSKLNNAKTIGQRLDDIQGKTAIQKKAWFVSAEQFNFINQLATMCSVRSDFIAMRQRQLEARLRPQNR